MRQKLVKAVISFISALDALIPKGTGSVADPAKGRKAAINAFTELCKVTAVELSYLAAMGSEAVRRCSAPTCLAGCHGHESDLDSSSWWQCREVSK